MVNTEHTHLTRPLYRINHIHQIRHTPTPILKRLHHRIILRIIHKTIQIILIRANDRLIPIEAFADNVDAGCGVEGGKEGRLDLFDGGEADAVDGVGAY